MIDYEFYETPEAATRLLFRDMTTLGHSIYGTVYEPCVGSGAIPRAQATLADEILPPWSVDRWLTNDLDPRWPADTHMDAALPASWPRDVDFTVSNTPFSAAIDIADHALRFSRRGVALHLRGSIHEVLKTGPRRRWFREHPPTGTIWLPRFAFQRNKKGEWATDSVTCCWVVWLKQAPAGYQFIRYAGEQMLRELDAETPAYRARMDALMAQRAA